MKSKLKILTADDSVVVRRLLTEMLEQHEEIEVVYPARNGSEAVGAFTKYQPDVVLLDVQMPIMNGLEATAAIRAIDPDVPIIMFSTVTRKGAESTLVALSRGACDYETKPSLVGHLDDAKKHITEQLIPKILNWGRKRLRGESLSRIRSNPSRSQAAPTPPPVPSTSSAPRILAVGASTGGPDALKGFLRSLPGDFPLPVVIVQHMPAIFTATMAERLDEVCPLNVSEAKHGTVLTRGHVLVAPGDYHMTVAPNPRGYEVQLSQEEPVNFCRPSVDVLFKSVATHFGGSTLAIVLTGMGKDGLEGAREIERQGGFIMAQDEESSVVYGMPKAIVDDNLALCVLPPRELAEAVLDVVAAKPHLAKIR